MSRLLQPWGFGLCSSQCPVGQISSNLPSWLPLLLLLASMAHFPLRSDFLNFRALSLVVWLRKPLPSPYYYIFFKTDSYIAQNGLELIEDDLGCPTFCPHLPSTENHKCIPAEMMWASREPHPQPSPQLPGILLWESVHVAFWMMNKPLPIHS